MLWVDIHPQHSDIQRSKSHPCTAARPAAMHITAVRAACASPTLLRITGNHGIRRPTSIRSSSKGLAARARRQDAKSINESISGDGTRWMECGWLGWWFECADRPCWTAMMTAEDIAVTCAVDSSTSINLCTSAASERSRR